MRNVSNKSCRENQNTHFMFCNFLSENHPVYNIEKCGGARQAANGNMASLSMLDQ
jgi:hypothetical protein